MKETHSRVTTFVVGGALVLLACLAIVGVSIDIAAMAAQQDAPKPRRQQVDLEFSHLSQQRVPGDFYRSKVPGGWLVVLESHTSTGRSSGSSMAFVPDPDHTWDGKSLP